MAQPCIPGVFHEGAPRIIADASLEGFARIQPTLTARERHVLALIECYLKDTSYPDVTGGELAAWSGESILSIRPRLTGLLAKAWIEIPQVLDDDTGEWRKVIRASRADGEHRCHPVRPVVSWAAIQRTTPPAKTR